MDNYTIDTIDSSNFGGSHTVQMTVGVGQTLLYQIDQQLHNETGTITHRFICEENSTLELLLVLTGGKLVTHCIEILLNGPGAHARLTGGYAMSGDQNLSVSVVQEHRAPHTTSYSCIKGAVTDNAQVEYRGIITIAPEAQHTDAALYNKNLLLSAQARALSVPSLEVRAHNVQCKHGCAIGRFDEEQLMYMSSRGLARAQAEKLLVQGFFSDELVLTDEQRTRLLQKTV